MSLYTAHVNGEQTRVGALTTFSPREVGVVVRRYLKEQDPNVIEIRKAVARVRFLHDDPAGLWKAGETAEALGRESDHPDAPHIFLFRLDDGQVIALTRPRSRGLVEPVE